LPSLLRLGDERKGVAAGGALAGGLAVRQSEGS